MKERVSVEEIDKYITDLPRHEELSRNIADCVNTHSDYNLAQVGQIIDEHLGESRGLSIAEDIESIF